MYLIKNFERPLSEIEIKQKILSSRQKALSCLEKIQSQSLTSEEYYQKLSDTVRHYIEERTGLRAPHYTTQEFLVKMQENPFFSHEIQQALTDFLTYSDKVKFARHEPQSKDWETTCQVAKNLIIAF